MAMVNERGDKKNGRRKCRKQAHCNETLTSKTVNRKTHTTGGLLKRRIPYGRNHASKLCHLLRSSGFAGCQARGRLLWQSSHGSASACLISVGIHLGAPSLIARFRILAVRRAKWPTACWRLPARQPPGSANRLCMPATHQGPGSERQTKHLSAASRAALGAADARCRILRRTGPAHLDHLDA